MKNVIPFAIFLVSLGAIIGLAIENENIKAENEMLKIEYQEAEHNRLLEQTMKKIYKERWAKSNEEWAKCLLSCK